MKTKIKIHHALVASIAAVTIVAGSLALLWSKMPPSATPVHKRTSTSVPAEARVALTTADFQRSHEAADTDIVVATKSPTLQFASAPDERCLAF